MTALVRELVRAISQLEEKDMVRLHERLITLIHDEAEEDGLDPAFRDEILRRVQGIDGGTARSVDAFEALKEM